MDKVKVYMIYYDEVDIYDLFDICSKLINEMYIYIGFSTKIKNTNKILLNSCKYFSDINEYNTTRQHNKFIKKHNITIYQKIIGIDSKNIVNCIKTNDISIKLNTSKNVTTSSELEKLIKIDINNIKATKICFDGIYYAKVINVYDGDTLTLLFLIDDKPMKYSCRMTFYNASEIKGGNEEETKKATEQKLFLQTIVNNPDNNGICRVLFHNKNCPYKRPLITLFNKNETEFNFDNSINKKVMDEYKLELYNPSKIKL